MDYVSLNAKTRCVYEPLDLVLHLEMCIRDRYNSIYVDYDYIVELLGLEYTASTGSEVYIDKIEHIDAVKKQLKKMYGDNVEIYDNTSNYLDSECKVVGLMVKTSKIICWMIIIMCEIILLIVFSFYTIQYQKDTGLFLSLIHI